MIFPGRLLASQAGLTIWQNHQGPGYQLHFVNRGVVVDLSEEELGALGEVASGAIQTAGTSGGDQGPGPTAADSSGARERLSAARASGVTGGDNLTSATVFGS